MKSIITTVQRMLANTVAGTTDAPALRPTIGLALGSGGANGLAHIAILQVFDELGIVPDRITGTSIGAVIGGLYAAGLSAQQIRDIFAAVAGSPMEAFSGLAKSDVKLARLLRFWRRGAGLLDSSGFMHVLAAHIKPRTFAELRIPLTVVATDYWTADTVAINEGNLFRAIEASMAVPGLFMPVRHGEHLLIDGGTSNPLPFDLLQGQVDLVIAVDVSGNHQPNNGQELGMSDMLFNSFKIMQQSITRQALRYQPPDILIKPEAPGVRLAHFHRINEILEQAAPAAATLRELLIGQLDNSFSELGQATPAS